MLKEELQLIYRNIFNRLTKLGYMERQDNNGFRISRRDFLKISATTAIAAGAAYAASKNFVFNIFSPPIDDEQLQTGWEYSYVPNVCAFCSSTCDILASVERKGQYVKWKSSFSSQ